MSITQEYLSRLGRVKKTACIMMRDRGYILPPDEDELLQKSDTAVVSKYVTSAMENNVSLCLAMSSKYASHDENHAKTLLLFVDLNFDESKQREKMVSCEQAKDALKFWSSSFRDCPKCILIVAGKLSHDAKREISNPNVSIMTHDFLSFPVGRHCMVLPHTGLSKKDADVFYKARQITPDQLPRIKVTDPVCLYYGFELGTLVRIDRPLAHTFYRVVGT